MMTTTAFLRSMFLAATILVAPTLTIHPAFSAEQDLADSLSVLENQLAEVNVRIQNLEKEYKNPEETTEFRRLQQQRGELTQQLLQTRTLLQETQKAILRVYPLQFVNPKEVVNVFRQLNLDESAMFAVDERTNSLIVSAAKDAQEKVAPLLQVLDREPPAKKAEMRTQLYQLRSIPDFDAFVQFVGRMFDDSNTIIQPVSAQRLLIDASPETHRRIEALIAEFFADGNRPDAMPTANRRVRIVWLVSQSDAAQNAAPSSGLPSDLKDVIAELEKLGITQLQAAAQSIIRTTDQGRFTVTALASLADSPCNLAIDGQFVTGQQSERAPAMRISLRANRRVEAGQEELARIETTISAPFGHPVVLGVSPMGSLTSAFVVTVFED